jgi:hypothetical protein
MTLLGTMIMIAWGNFIRNYILRWLIAIVVYYMPTNKQVDFTMLTIVEFFTTGLALKVQGVVAKTALLVPVNIHVRIREIFVFDINATDPFFKVTLSKPIVVGSKDIYLDQDLQIKILKNDRFQEFACRLILGMKQMDIRLEATGDFDFWLLKVSNLALRKYLYFSNVDRSKKESKIIPDMTFKPTPVLPSLYIFIINALEARLWEVVL